MKTNLKQKITNYLNSLSDELRVKLEYRKNKPHTPKLNKLGKFALILFTVIYLFVGCLGGIKSSAAELFPTSTYAVGNAFTLPAGTYVADTLSRPAFTFNQVLSFTCNGIDYSSIRFVIVSEEEAYIYYDDTRVYGFGYISGWQLANGNTIVLENDGGVSLDFGDWFNANFTMESDAPDEPEPTIVTVPAGIYYLRNIYNDLRGTIDFYKPFTTSNGEEFVSIEFAGYNNNQYTQVFYYTNPVTDAGPSPSVPKPIYNGVNGFTNISDCIIFLEEDTVIEYYDELWDDTFVAVNSDTKLINLYNGAFNIGDAEGYDRGYLVGDSDGYQEGYDDGRSHGMADGFMSNFFGGIVDALDALTLFGNISMLDIVEGIIGLMLCLWILKLIAGG